jgi:hypothetical protein
MDRLKINFSGDISISKQPFNINGDMPSKPVESLGFKNLADRRSSVSVISVKLKELL